MKRERGQRGAALVVALLVVLVLSLLEIALIVTTTTETKVSSTQLRDTQALTIAEAGIEEVIGRMLLEREKDKFIGDTGSPLNPDWCTIVVLHDPPSGNDDTTWVKTVQQGRYKLHYATEDENGPPEDFLSVHHKTGGTNGDSIYFGTDQKLEAPDYDGNAVEVIEVTGTQGNANRRIITEVVRMSPTIIVEAAFRVNSNVRVTGTLDVCGHDHSPDLWDDFDLEPPACSTYHLEPCHRPPEEDDGQTVSYWDDTDTDCDEAGCMEAVELNGSFDHRGSARIWGNPALDSTPENPFYELYEILGFGSEDEMIASINWQSVVTGDHVRGFCVAEADEFRPGGGTGRGVLWVMGNLRVAANYKFKGLIYVEGWMKASGGSRFLGSVVVNSEFERVTGGTGTAQIHLSTQAVQEEVAGALARFVRLSWREKP